MKKWFSICGLAAIAGLGMLLPNQAAAASLPVLAISNASGFEGDLGETNNFNFTATLTPASTQTVSVAFCTTNGSAQAGSDYGARIGALIFLPGETNKTIAIQVLGDNTHETNETFRVQLYSATNAVLNGLHGTEEAMGTIVDDDAALIFSSSVLEGDVGTNNNIVFQIQLAQASAMTVSVAYTTVNGTATAGEDFIATNGIITFMPGQTNQNVSVCVVGDIHHEFDEVFYVRLSGSTNSENILVREKQAAGTIWDNGDHFFFLTAYPASVNEGTPGVATNQMRFLVTLNQPGTNVVTVNYQTFNASSADISYYFDAYQAIDEYTNFIPSFVFEGSGTPARAGVDYIGVTNTLTFLPGQTTQYVTVHIIGNSTQEAADKPLILYLSKPSNAEIYNDSTVIGVIVDDDASGTPVVTISNEAVVEGDNGETNRTMLFHVQLSSVRHAPFALSFATTNTAIAGNNASATIDYVPTSGTLNFANGEADKFVPVTIRNDNLNETNEIFRVKLTTPAGVIWANNATYGGIGTVIDNDPLPYVTISSYTNFEGDTVNNTIKLFVKLSAPSGRAVTVSYATVPGTAAAGSDYKTAAGTVTFPPGTITNSISLTVYGDVLPEPDETFYVNLTKPVNATIAVAQGLGVIRNDDIERFITIGSAQVAEGHSESTNIIFTVSLSSPCAQPVWVDYVTANGTAVAGSDYGAKTGALIFPPGVTNQTISVETFGDITLENNEDFYIDLSNPINASLGASRGAGTISNDDGLPGQVHRFAWSAMAATQFVSQPFTVTITALDISNQPVTNFTGPANLAGTVRAVTRDTNMLGDLTAQLSQNLGSANFSAGFAFTPNTNLVVTHVRHYFGTNVSIWTGSGVLLASQPVASVPGSWRETSLSTPLTLTNGHTYRLVCIASGSYQYRAAPTTSFADGSLGQNYLGFGTSFPSAPVNVQNLVDLRYTKVLNLVPIAITPGYSGVFTNGVWAGTVAVLQTATNAFLTATDNDGHTGSSANFNVTAFSHMFTSLGYELVSTDGAKHFKLLTTDGRAYVIERSTDLLNWTPIYTNQTGLTGCDCVDSMAPTATRFYRARRYLVTEPE